MFFFRNKQTEPRWLMIIRTVCGVIGAGLLAAYAAYVIEKVLQDSNSTTTTTEILDVIQMPNALVCPVFSSINTINLTFSCIHLNCTSTLLSGYPAGSYGNALDIEPLPSPCYHITWEGIVNTSIVDYYPPGLIAVYAYENGTEMSLTDYLGSSYGQQLANQWQITFFETSTDPINTLYSPAPAGLSVPPCYFYSILCSGCVDIMSCNSVFSSIEDLDKRSQVIDYVLNDGYTFLLNSSQFFEEVTFQGMQIDITLTPSWKNRLGILSETNRVSRMLVTANQLPLKEDIQTTTAFSIQNINPHGRLIVTTNKENRTDTVLTALGAIGGIFTLIQGIYKLLFGKTAESPWGLVQTYTFGNLRDGILKRIKDSYALNGDYLPLTIPTNKKPTLRSLEKLNRRLEAVERMLAEHYVDVSMLEFIQKNTEADTDENDTTEDDVEVWT